MVDPSRGKFLTMQCLLTNQTTFLDKLAIDPEAPLEKWNHSRCLQVAGAQFRENLE